MKPRRIAQVIEATTGGTRRHLLDLVNGLDPERFEFHVICATRRDPAFLADIEALRARGITVHIVPMTRAVSPQKDTAACRQLIRLLRRESYDAVHTHSSKAGVLGRIAARRAGVPAVIHTPHVFPFDMRSGAAARLLYRAIERRLARWSDRIVCVSRAGMLSAAAAGVAPAGQYDIIPNGVDLEELDGRPPQTADRKHELGIPPAAPVVGAVGRLSRQKNFRLLIDAADAVCHTMPEVYFVIVGEGEERQRLERRIEAAGLRERVLLPGRKEDIYPWYPMFDVFALSSDWEGMPYSLLEAMGCRRPVVATAVGGVAEAIRSGSNGIVVPPHRPRALSAALIDRLRAPAAERQRMGRAARETVGNHFAKQTMLSALENLYEETIEKRRQR